jgi:hypothetical protein
MTTRRILAFLGAGLLAGCTGDRFAPERGPDVYTAAQRDVVQGNATFTPGESGSALPAHVVRARELMGEMEREGLAVAVLERPTPGHLAWLIHDPALLRQGLPANWIVSSDGRLPGPPEFLSAMIAVRRARHGVDRLHLALLEDGRSVEELTGRVSRRVGRLGPDHVLGPGTGETHVLPRLGRVRVVSLQAPADP